MRQISSMAAIAAVLVATSIRSADARHGTSYIYSAGCGAAVMGSEAGDANANCLRLAADRKRVRLGRSSDVRRRHVSRGGASCGGSLSAVRARSGAIACVASRAAGRFQAFVSALEATGYRIDFMGGWRSHGSCRGCNMHPRGLAIDINQTGRNRVTRRLPAGVTELAEQNGLLHGAVWANADAGHFELMSESPTRFAYASERYARRSMNAYASARHARRPVDAYASVLSTRDPMVFAGRLAAQNGGY